MEPSVVVVGAGVFGASAALEIARRCAAAGKGRRVELVSPSGLEPDALASTTDISKIVRLEYGADAEYTDMCELALAGWARWNAEAAAAGLPRPLFYEDGLLVLAGPRHGLRAGAFEGDSLREMRARGHAVEELPDDAAALARRFPAFRGVAQNAFAGGFFDPRSGWANSGETLKWLLLQCAAQPNLRVRRAAAEALLLAADGARVVGVRLAADDAAVPAKILPAQTVVLAAGAFSPRLLPALAAVMRPLAQVVCHFALDDPADRAAHAAPALPAFTAAISESGYYGFPLHPTADVLKIGHHGPGYPIDPAMCTAAGLRAATERLSDAHVSAVRKDLARMMPAVARARLHSTRVCLYCDTFDGDFMIDAVPKVAGLFVAAGGSGHGFKFAPILGGLIADVVLGVPNRFAHRFRWREPASGSAAAVDGARQRSSPTVASTTTAHSFHSDSKL